MCHHAIYGIYVKSIVRLNCNWPGPIWSWQVKYTKEALADQQLGMNDIVAVQRNTWTHKAQNLVQWR